MELGYRKAEIVRNLWESIGFNAQKKGDNFLIITFNIYII
jgi:hypothetical protein